MAVLGRVWLSVKESASVVQAPAVERQVITDPEAGDAAPQPDCLQTGSDRLRLGSAPTSCPRGPGPGDEIAPMSLVL